MTAFLHLDIVSSLTWNPGYARWLQSFQVPLEGPKNFYEISERAYEQRHSHFLCVESDTVSGASSRMDNAFRTAIRHLIGRLCAPTRAAKLLTYAATRRPHIFCGFSIQSQEPDPVLPRPSEHAGLTLEGISRRMFPSHVPADLNAFREALQTLEEKGSIMSRVLERYRSKTWRPRVHAELTLLEELHHRKCAFFDDDKYIACSKSACFCCYHYISHHPGSFIRPPCHMKLYINWQIPSLANDSGDARALEQRDIMNKLTQEVRRAVVERVLKPRNHMKWHPDSSTGITLLTSRGSGLQPHSGSPRSQSVSSMQGRESGDACSQTDAGSSCGEDSEDGGVSLVCSG